MEEQEILQRSSLLSLSLLVATAFVVIRIYGLWQEGPWESPRPARGREFSAVEDQRGVPRSQWASTKNIIEKNLFDPERGAGQANEAEASSAAAQRLRKMVLLGTAILEQSRYAVFQDPAGSRGGAPTAQAGQPGQLRLKLGDTLEGFRLSQIHEDRVVFTKGSSRVEITLDFFRKLEEPRQREPSRARTMPVPRIAPPAQSGRPR